VKYCVPPVYRRSDNGEWAGWSAVLRQLAVEADIISIDGDGDDGSEAGSKDYKSTTSLTTGARLISLEFLFCNFIQTVM
jgi:hypothetical protein